MQFENSEVVPFGSVAVAATRWPVASGTALLNTAFPRVSVVIVVKSRKRSPSPYPEESHAVLENSSTLNVVLGVPLSAPATVALPPDPDTDVSVGGERSLASGGLKLIPNWLLENIELESMELLLSEATNTP
jgi:hypothetical protein